MAVVKSQCTSTLELKIRVFDKVNSCFICEKLLKVKLTRHLISVHVDNTEVARILSKSSNEEIAKEMELLQHKGNFLHNEHVQKLGKGSLILARRPTDMQEVDANQYRPCPNCLAYVALSNLWRYCHYHCICSYGNKEKGKRDIVKESQALQDSVGTGACDLLLIPLLVFENVYNRYFQTFLRPISLSLLFPYYMHY